MHSKFIHSTRLLLLDYLKSIVVVESPKYLKEANIRFFYKWGMGYRGDTTNLERVNLGIFGKKILVFSLRVEGTILTLANSDQILCLDPSRTNNCK